MAGASLYCTRCLSLLSFPADAHYQEAVCPSCAANLEFWLLPALFRPQTAEIRTRPAAPGEAGCFNHPGRQATIECEGCGRFLCALCDMEARGRHLCPLCFDKKRVEGNLSQLPDRITRYDRIALAVTLLPMLFCCGPSLVTVPVALFIVIKYWTAPGSERPSVRRTMVFSLVLGVMQILFLVLWMYVVFTPPNYRNTMGV
ncbi:MAG: hypothetical protein EHM61_01325 [Acidobacteria bacterium]|nr:MAG: hypothetical protein EHM61_01325 [Acidobacteriota bacterium]